MKERKMKKLLIIPAALVTLASCGTKTVYMPQPAQTNPPVETIPEQTYSKEDVFVTTINGEYPYVQSQLGGRAELIQFGKLVCQAIDEGSTMADFAMMAVNNDVDPEMLGYIMGAAIVAFCPSNSWFMDQATN